MVLNACCSCCCMSSPQATHSPWQSLRPGVKRHASSTTRYHRGIFIAQHSQTEEGQTGAQQLEEKFQKWGSPARETGGGGGNTYEDQGRKQTYILRQYQSTGLISWIWVSQSVGVGNEFSQRQERTDMCGMKRKHNWRIQARKMDIFPWVGNGCCRTDGWTTDENQPAEAIKEFLLQEVGLNYRSCQRLWARNFHSVKWENICKRFGKNPP